MSARRRWLLLLVLLVLPCAALARVGGGSSFSGSRGSSFSGSRGSSFSSGSRSSSSSSSGWGGHSSTVYYSSGSSGDVSPVIVMLVVLVVLGFVIAKGAELLESGKSYEPSTPPAPSLPTPARDVAQRLRSRDPTFSEPVFLEWVTLLYLRAMQGRGVPSAMEAVAPWFADPQAQLSGRIGTYQVKRVRGVVVGSQKLLDAQLGPDSTEVAVLITSCLTAELLAGEQALYVTERWTFRRKNGVTSRTPDTVTREGCPACGAAFEREVTGACSSCGASLQPGESDWYVKTIRTQLVETRPPLLEGNAEEIGTDLRTVIDPSLLARLKKLSAKGFDREKFLARARVIFMNLQEAWSDQQWAKLRPYETEALFQSHRFWMEEYKRQGLRNRLTEVDISDVELVKVTIDASYEAITCRIHASMIDVTTRGSRVVGGNPRAPRVFTEYWTFLQRPGAKGSEDDTKCPNCAAPLKVNQAGVCEYCQAVVTRGEFDWVLTRIEQDEDYTG
jgi:hypothetical protein